MIGDVNLFLKGTRPEGSVISGGGTNAEEDEDDFEVEIEIMIAG